MTYDRGRPLHVFDADKLKGAIRARLGRKGEQLQALDGKTYEVGDEDCVIADDRAVLGLGGSHGRRGDRRPRRPPPTSSRVGLFRSDAHGATGRELNIESDARYRFERGVDPAFRAAGTRACQQARARHLWRDPKRGYGRRQTARAQCAFQIRSWPRSNA